MEVRARAKEGERGGGGGVGEGLVASTPFLFPSFPLLLFYCAPTFEL